MSCNLSMLAGTALWRRCCLSVFCVFNVEKKPAHRFLLRVMFFFWWCTCLKVFIGCAHTTSIFIKKIWMVDSNFVPVPKSMFHLTTFSSHAQHVLPAMKLGVKSATDLVMRTALSWWAIPFSGILFPSPWWERMDFCHLQKLSRDLSAWWFISKLGWNTEPHSNSSNFEVLQFQRANH